MPLHEFWYEDFRLFSCYVKAYRERSNNTAWLTGLYVFEAVSCAINNIMPGAIGSALSGKRRKAINYHEKPINLFHRETKKPQQENNAQNMAAVWAKRIKQLKGMGA